MGNNTIRISLLLIPISGLFIITFILAACGGSTTSAPTTTITTTTTSETTIPSDYTTYTSEGLFSISYPPDWEYLPSMAEWIELNIKEELITIIESDLPIEDGSPISESYIFYAFGPTGHVGIVALSPPAVTWTLDSVVEVWSYTIDDPALNYNELSRIKTTVDGREVVIIDYQFSIPIETIGGTTVGGNNHNLWMFTLAGKTAWTIMCGTSSEMFSDYEEALHAVINSFRILCSPTTTNTYTPPPTSSIRITPTTIHIN